MPRVLCLSASSTNLPTNCPRSTAPKASQRRQPVRLLTLSTNSRPDIVLVIGAICSPRMVGPAGDFRRSLRHLALRRNAPHEATPKRYPHHLGALASYSPLDAQHLREQGLRGARHPNAYDTHCPVVPMRGTPSTLSALSTPTVRRPCRRWSLPVCRCVPTVVLVASPYDILRTKRFKDSGVPAGRDIDRSEAYGIMASSRQR